MGAGASIPDSGAVDRPAVEKVVSAYFGAKRAADVSPSELSAMIAGATTPPRALDAPTLAIVQRELDIALDKLESRAALEGARVFDGVLEPGDVTIFDMRVLHCGQPNLADLGDQRFFLNFTFCNPRADCSDLGHAPCIRPGYARRMTLADVRAQLASAAPFADLGDGLR